MHILEVIPLTVLPSQVPQVLSYFSDLDLPKGSIIEIPLHNRKVTAVVISSQKMEGQRILVKKSAFQLKKISRVLSEAPQVGEYQFKIALWLASEYLSPLGLALKTTLQPFFLKKRYPIATQPFKEIESLPKKSGAIICRSKASEKYILSTDAQTLIIIPEMSYISYFKKRFAEADVVNSATDNKSYYEIWGRVASGQSKMIIGTRQALFLPFSNLKKVIVIDPLHEFYKSDFSPKYKTPALAEYISMLYGAQYTAIGNILGTTNYIQSENNNLEIKDTLGSWSVQPEIIDLIAEMKQGYVGALSQTLKKRVIDAIKSNKKILIFASRRGYAGVVVCKRCGFTVNCPRCSNPMRVHLANDKILVCHHCSMSIAYPQYCGNCHSSDLKPSGPAGSQKIFEELQKMIQFGQLDRVQIMILDADVTKNQTEEDEIMETVRKPGPKILIATAKIFSYIFDDSFDLVAIPQYDALSTSPDYQTTERLWQQLEKLADFNPDKFIIQTYDTTHIPHQVFTHDYQKLYKDDAIARELFTYPPYSKIVKLTYSNRRPQAAVHAGRLLIEKLKMAATHLRIIKLINISDSSPMFLSKIKDVYTFAVIVKVSLELKSVRDLIKYAPTGWLIDVDPRQII